MPERGAQRTGNVEVATPGFRIDVGGAAAAVAPVDPEQRLADPDVAADPVELLPGACAVDVEIGAKTQRIDLDAPLLFEAAYGRQIDQRDDVVRLVHEMPVRRADQRRRAAQRRNQLREDFLDLRATGFVVEVGDDQLTIALRNRQLQRFDIQRSPHPRQCLLQHQHDEQALLAPFRLAGVERRAGAHQREDAIMRKRLLGLQVDAWERLRAQSLDRIAIDILQNRHRRATLSYNDLAGKCTMRRRSA